jgi:phosphoenolpyruvate synthase/pyruvate phosphate dikinase
MRAGEIGRTIDARSMAPDGDEMTISMVSTPKPVAEPPAPVIWRGVAASRGAGRGRVFMVRGAGDAAAAPPGSVIVADWLPAAWVPLLQQPAAVLVARGGALSKAATALREQRVPAVAGVAGFIGLREGDDVEVDGGAGSARRL